MSQPHLFKIGPTTYAICGVGENTAYAYVREVMRVKPENYKYLGTDNRTPKQQYDSFTVGIDASGFKPSKLLSMADQEQMKRDQEEKDARPKTKCQWCNGTGYN